MADRDVKIVGPVNISGRNGIQLNLLPNKAVVVVPSASGVYDEGLLFVGVGGDVYARPSGQLNYVLFKNVAGGTFLPVYIVAVSNDASTTATDMLICY